MMRIGLFVPCYVDQVFPDVGMATVEVLEHYGVEVDFPSAQTCCGQPMDNMGFCDDARKLARRHVEIFQSYEHVVCPSASCVAMVRKRYPEILEGVHGVERAARSTFELCEFLTDVLGIEHVGGRFPEKVGLHPSCHGLRELRLGPSSELGGRGVRDCVRSLLSSVEGLELVTPERLDECCGFGGAFAVEEAAVSCQMGRDRIADFAQAGATVITATDVSCLAHFEGLLRRESRHLRVMHVAQILASVTSGEVS